ncbi:MAG: hypothetical protein ACI9KN_000766 [Gammaproteobacteria bacterium]
MKNNQILSDSALSQEFPPTFAVYLKVYISSFVDSGGAVHLYNPLSTTLIGSIFGDAPGDSHGSSSITVLANNNYVIASACDDEGMVRIAMP